MITDKQEVDYTETNKRAQHIERDTKMVTYCIYTYQENKI